MKWLFRILGLIALVFVIVYTLAFTSIGNTIVAPIAEGKINETLGLESKLETFELKSSSLNIILALTPENKITIVGNFSLLAQSFNISYRLRLNHLQDLKSLTKETLYGKFHTEGTVIGDLKKIDIKGSSDIASSKTTYDVTLTDFNPSSIKAIVDGAKTEELLALVGKSPYAISSLHVNADMSSVDPKNLQGDVKMTLENGHINSELMKQDFNVTLPQTEFALNSHAALKGKDIDYTLKLNSNLATIGSSGTIEPESMGMDLQYHLNIAMLELLKPITNAPLRGEFNLKGDVKGDKKSLHVKGSSDLAGSETTFNAQLQEFKPKEISADITNLKLEKLLYMVEQPHYLQNGILNSKIRIVDARSGKLDGSVETRITKGLVDGKSTAKAFEFKPMPRITFDAKTRSDLKGNIVTSNLDINSNIMTLDVKEAKLNLDDSSLHSDYVISLLDLSKLYFATEQEMRGSIAFNGEVKKAEVLDFTAHSSTLDGTIDAHLHNDDFKAQLKNLQTLKILHMIIYPEIFQSSLNGTLNYNLALKKGTMDSNLSDGKFMKNQMGDLLKQYAKYDLYQERFQSTIKSDITPLSIKSNLMMKGGAVSINDPKMIIAPKSKQIKSDLKIVVNKNPVTIKLRGNVQKPDVTIDANELIKREAGKAVEKELGNLLKGLF